MKLNKVKYYKKNKLHYFLLISILIHSTTLFSRESVKYQLKQIPIYDSAIFLNKIEPLLRKYKQQQDFESQSEIYSYIRKFHKYNRNHELQFKYGKRSLYAAFHSRNKELINLRKLQIVFDDLHKSEHESENELKKLYKVAIKNHWKKSQFIAYCQLANINADKFQYNKGIIFCNKALDIAREINDTEDIAFVCLNLGTIYFKNSDFKNARKYFFKALYYYQLNNDKIGQGIAYNSLANVEGMLKNAKAQIFFYNKSVSNAKIIHNKEGLSFAYYNLAAFYFEIEYRRDKIDHYINLLLLDKELNPLLRDKALSLKIQVALKENDFDTLNYYFNQLTIENLDLETKSEIYQIQSKIEEKKKNYSKAFAFLKENVRFEDSLHKLNQLKSYKLLDEIVEKNKLKQQLINNKIKEQKTQNQLKFTKLIIFGIVLFTLGIFVFYVMYSKLKYSKKISDKTRDFSIQLISNLEDERSRIAMELHDGINQQLAMTKTKLELYQLGKLNTISTLHLDIKNIIDETRLICYKMFPSQLVEKEFESAVRELINKINELNTLQIIFEMKCKVDTLSIEKQTHVFRIIQECINNTIKYAKASSVLIEFSKNDTLYRLKYSDNGIGIENIHADHKGIGLSTINQRVQILNGKFELITNKQKGFNLTIYFND